MTHVTPTPYSKSRLKQGLSNYLLLIRVGLHFFTVAPCSIKNLSSR